MSRYFSPNRILEIGEEIPGSGKSTASERYHYYTEFVKEENKVRDEEYHLVGWFHTGLWSFACDFTVDVMDWFIEHEQAYMDGFHKDRKYFIIPESQLKGIEQ